MKLNRRETIFATISSFIGSFILWGNNTKWWEQPGFNYSGVPVNFTKINIEQLGLLPGFQEFNFRNLSNPMR